MRHSGITIVCIIFLFNWNFFQEDEPLITEIDKPVYLAWSPNASILAVQSADTTIHLYDEDFTATSIQPATPEWSNYVDIERVTSSMKGMAWSPDSTFLVAPNLGEAIADNKFVIWNIETIEKVSIIKNKDTSAVSWSSNGNLLAASGIVSWDDSETLQVKWFVTIWNMKDMCNCFIDSPLYEKEITSLDWCPCDEDKQLLAVGFADGSLDIWDLTSNSSLFSFQPQQSRLNDLAWSPDGKFIATGSDGGIHIWNTETQAGFTLGIEMGNMNSIDWNSAANLLAGAGSDGVVRIWNVESEEIRLTLEGHEGEIISLDWGPNNIQIATASTDNTVRIWDVSDLAPSR